MTAGDSGGLDALSAPDVTPEELEWSMPESMRGLFPAFEWSVDQLWRLDLPADELPLERFDWLLGIPFWRWMGRRWQLSLRDVLGDPGGYEAHVRKAMDADLAHPIHIAESRDGHPIILDGYHRLLRAILAGHPTIRAVTVRRADLEALHRRETSA
ncbi:MAG TPA: hypothetical protein VIA06_15410 [Candidatus Dormibacteraeota bacterium]|nr:hypothetical protein [Candidatus Dormibacteraeota bacterium]